MGVEAAVSAQTNARARPDPFRRFAAWYARAEAVVPELPNAMTLATAGADGQPSARIVLLKRFDEQGFVFFTNTRSRKGRELAANPRVALVFWWPQLRRQVRIEGRAARVSAAEADAYFASRPRGYRLGAWASQQSRPLPEGRSLTADFDALRQTYKGKPVPRPTAWGGYRVAPERFEFWTHRENRLHERVEYRRAAGDAWRTRKLQP